MNELAVAPLLHLDIEEWICFFSFVSIVDSVQSIQADERRNEHLKPIRVRKRKFYIGTTYRVCDQIGDVC